MKEKEMEEVLNSDLEQIAEVVQKSEKPENPEKASNKKRMNFEPKRILHFYKNLSFPLKVAITLPLIFAVLGFILTGIVLAFKLDSYVFKTSAEGEVRQFDDSLVQGVKVCIKDKCAETNEEGKFKIAEIKYGKNTIIAEKEGFQKFSEEFKFKRGENVANFKLKYSNTGTIKGKVSDPAGNLNIDGMAIQIADSDNSLEADGSFTIENVPTGKHIIKLRTPNYMDMEKEIDVVEGNVTVEFAALEPAGDIVLMPKDWLSGEIVKDLTIGENLQVKTEYTTTNLAIKDLNIGEKVNLRLSKNGYNTKELGDVEVVQGATDKGEAQMVRSGKVVYVSDRTGNKNIYIANLDGSEEKRLSDNKGSSYSPYLTTDGKYVRFLSTRDGVKNEYGYPIALAYSVDVKSGKITKLSKTKYEENDNNIENYDFASMKRSFRNENKLNVSNLDGTNVKTVDTGEQYFGAEFSNNGQFMIYSSYIYNYTTQNSTYMATYADIASGKTTKMFESTGKNTGIDIHDISDDRKYALFQNSSDGKFNVVMRDLTKKQNTTIVSSSEAKSQLEFSPDSKNISFIAHRDGVSNLYIMNLETKKEIKLSSEDNVNGYTWMGDLIYFSAKNKLSVVDTTAPGVVKVITDKVAFDSGYYD